MEVLLSCLLLLVHFCLSFMHTHCTFGFMQFLLWWNDTAENVSIKQSWLIAFEVTWWFPWEAVSQWAAIYCTNGLAYRGKAFARERPWYYHHHSTSWKKCCTGPLALERDKHQIEMEEPLMEAGLYSPQLPMNAQKRPKYTCIYKILQPLSR